MVCTLERSGNLPPASTARAPIPTLSGAGKEALYHQSYIPQAPCLCCLPAGLLAGDFQLAGFQLLELSGQRPELGKPEALFGTAGELRGVPRESLLPGVLSRAGRGAALLFSAM